MKYIALCLTLITLTLLINTDKRYDFDVGDLLSVEPTETQTSDAFRVRTADRRGKALFIELRLLYPIPREMKVGETYLVSIVRKSPTGNNHYDVEPLWQDSCDVVPLPEGENR